MRQYIDFLGSVSPYDALDPDDLGRLAGRIQVEYVPAGTRMVSEGKRVVENLFVIRSGAVEVLDRGRVVDLLGQGDTFGFVSLLTGLPPALSVQTSEDSLIYRLPDPRSVLEHPERLAFAHYGSLAARTRLLRQAVVDTGARPVREFMRPVLWADPNTSVREAARVITDAHQSSVLLTTREGLGIATDADLRRAVATTADLDGPVAAIATLPALTTAVDTPRSQALLAMIENGVHHLVVTDVGGAAVGVLRVVDLASTDVRDPLLVRSAIDAACSADDVAEAAQMLPSTAVELVDSGIPAVRVGALLAAVREALLRRLVELVGDPGQELPASWLVLGSTARREPLPSSDLDTAVVWSGPDPDDHDPRGERGRASREAAGRVLDEMERGGLRRCPDGANATNPLFNRSRSAWVRTTTGWREHPGGDRALLLTSIAADSRPVTEFALGRSALERTRSMRESNDFLDLMMRFTTASKPPAGFVRDFVVEQSGHHRGQLDLKRGGLMPIASLGRWVAVVTGEPDGSTPERLRRGSRQGVLTTDEADSMVGAFELIYDLVLEREVEALRAGTPATTYLAPAALDPLTRRNLRSAFREIAHVQTRLQGEWVSRLG